MIKSILKRPISVTMSFIAVIVLGIVAIRIIPVSLLPNIDVPYVTVQVEAREMSARELDNGVVKPLNRQFSQILHIESIESRSKDGVATIKIAFEYGTAIDFAFIEVNEKIDAAMAFLPKEIKRPKVLKASATDIPAFYLNISLKEGVKFSPTPLFPVSSQFSELSDFTQNVLINRIEQLSQVAMVDVTGYSENELLIIPDVDKLNGIGITIEQMERVLKSKSINLGNLSIRDGEYQYNIRFDGSIREVNDIENSYVNINNKVCRIGDFAKVIEHPQKLKGRVSSNHADALVLAIIMQSDVQMSDLKKEMNSLVELFRLDYPNINFEVTRDQTELLEYSINNLVQNILVGAVLACLVMFLFIGNFRTPLLITISIPLSIIVSILIFHLLGISINIISLSGFALGIGMMVDNSIVVIDNITQRWQRGEKLIDAAANGTSEVFVPMLSSVLTTCAVFIPLVFMSDISGELFYDQAMSVAISLFSSLLIAMTAIPLYYYLFYKRKGMTPPKTESRFFDYHAAYEHALKWCFRRAKWVFMIVGVMCVGAVVLFVDIKKELFPPITKNDVLLYIDWNDKISLDENSRRVDALLYENSEHITQSTSMVGVHNFMLSHTRQCSPSEGVIYIETKDSESLETIKTNITTAITSTYSNAVFNFSTSGNVFDLIFTQDEANLVARLRSTTGTTPEPKELNSLIIQIEKNLGKHYIEPISYVDQVMFTPRLDVMALYDVTHSSLVKSLRTSLSENMIMTINRGQNSLPIVIGDNTLELSELLANTFIEVPSKEPNVRSVVLPVSTFLIETKTQDLKEIISGAEGDYYPLSLNVDDSNVVLAMEQIKKAVDDNPDFEVGFSGAYFSSREMISELVVILVVSLLLLFFILASQFESLSQPLIILSEIVIDLFGALVLLWIFGSSLNLMSMIGIVVMCGVVINDSILKIDTINRLRKDDGYSLLRAIMAGGSRRLTPIIMTSLTTILAISPFLSRGDMGSDLQYPLSLTLIGGMILGTIVSLFFIPLLYYSIYKKR